MISDKLQRYCDMKENDIKSHTCPERFDNYVLLWVNALRTCKNQESVNLFIYKSRINYVFEIQLSEYNYLNHILFLIQLSNQMQILPINSMLIMQEIYVQFPEKIKLINLFLYELNENRCRIDPSKRMNVKVFERNTGSPLAVLLNNLRIIFNIRIIDINKNCNTSYGSIFTSTATKISRKFLRDYIDYLRTIDDSDIAQEVISSVGDDINAGKYDKYIKDEKEKN